MKNPPLVFEVMLHLLELSVVFGIGAMIYVIKKYPKKERSIPSIEHRGHGEESENREIEKLKEIESEDIPAT